MAASGKLSDRQERAILALLAERTIEQAANAAQVGERSLHRWLKTDAVFIAAYREARATAVSQAISRLQQASGEAVDTLSTILRDTDAPAAVKVTAASRILDLAIRATELEELRRRVDELERHQEVPDAPAEEVSIVT